MIEGQFRSYNSYENEKSRLVLTVFAKNISLYEEKEEENEEKCNKNAVNIHK